jgi:hypothetical protein
VAREKADESIPTNLPAADVPPASTSKVSFAGFAALDMGADDGGAVPEEEDEDFGGLMVRDFAKSRPDSSEIALLVCH